MQAMIFAAGLGTRLRPWTLHHPKALVEVGGKPMLRRVIERLKDTGIERMVINVHHFADQIEDYLKANNNFDVEILISDERAALLDTGGGIAHADEYFRAGEDIIVYNADILSDFDLRRMVQVHADSQADATLLTADRETSRKLYFSKDDSLLRGWHNSATGESRPESFTPDGTTKPLAFGGVHIISGKVLKQLVEEAQTSTAFPIIPFYIKHIDDLAIKPYTPDEKYSWFDIGKPETLQKACESFA